MARKNFFDALLNKLAAFMKSPMFPVLIIIVVGFFGLIIVILMWPQISSFFGGFLGGTPPAVDGNTIVQPITHGAITSLPQTH